MRKDKTMIFRYDDCIDEELDYLCKSLSLTRSEVVRHCIDKIYNSTYLYDHFGHDEVVRCSFDQFLTLDKKP